MGYVFESLVWSASNKKYPTPQKKFTLVWFVPFPYPTLPVFPSHVPSAPYPAAASHPQHLIPNPTHPTPSPTQLQPLIPYTSKPSINLTSTPISCTLSSHLAATSQPLHCTSNPIPCAFSPHSAAASQSLHLNTIHLTHTPLPPTLIPCAWSPHLAAPFQPLPLSLTSHQTHPAYHLPPSHVNSAPTQLQPLNPYISPQTPPTLPQPMHLKPPLNCNLSIPTSHLKPHPPYPSPCTLSPHPAATYQPLHLTSNPLTLTYSISSVPKSCLNQLAIWRSKGLSIIPFH